MVMTCLGLDASFSRILRGASPYRASSITRQTVNHFPMKKKGLALLLALGGPRSGRSSGPGASDTSMAEPDQGGDTMAPGGGTMDDPDDSADDSMEAPSAAPSDSDDDSTMLPLPKGFKAPEMASGGGLFTTTLTGSIVKTPDGDKLKVTKVGDMALTPSMEAPSAADQDEDADTSAAPSDEDPDQSQQPALSNIDASYMKRKKDQVAAQKAFQPGR